MILIISFWKALSYCSEILERIHLVYLEVEHLKFSLDDCFFHVGHHLQMPFEANFLSSWI